MSPLLKIGVMAPVHIGPYWPTAGHRQFALVPVYIGPCLAMSHYRLAWPIDVSSHRRTRLIHVSAESENIMDVDVITAAAVYLHSTYKYYRNVYKYRVLKRKWRKKRYWMLTIHRNRTRWVRFFCVAYFSTLFRVCKTCTEYKIEINKYDTHCTWLGSFYRL